MFTPGLIGFSSNPNGIFPKLVRFFTNSKFSHTFIITEPYFGEASIQEASFSVNVKSFRYYEVGPESYELFKIRDNVVTNEQIHNSLSKCYYEFEGVQYGYLQLIWFVYRKICELFGKDVRRQKNWMSDGVICSELVYNYLWNLGSPFKELLVDFNADTIQAQDIYEIIINHPEIFELVEQKWKN